MVRNGEEIVQDKQEPMNDWWKIIAAAIVGAIVGSLVSFAGTYYTHGVALATVQQRLVTAEKRLDTIESKPHISPVPSISPVISPLPSPESVKIEIVNLVNNASVDVQRSETPGELACFYYVRGTSANVEPSDKLNWYVLVRPKGDDNWYIQIGDSEMNPANGAWSIKAWIGDTKTAPKTGETFDVAAVVTEPSRVEGKTKVGNLNDLQPKVRSIITGLKIGNIK